MALLKLGSTRRRLEAAHEAGREQGWHDCELHYRPLVTELRQRLADTESRYRLLVERAYADGWNAGQAFAVLGNAAWTRSVTRRAS